MKQQQEVCPVEYCDRCHLALGLREPRVLYRGKKYHRVCYEQLFSVRTAEVKFERGK